MGLLDQYQNAQSDDAADEGDEQDLRKKRADFERAIVIAESDLKKLQREKIDLEIGRRRLKKEAERVRVERDALDEKIKSMDNDMRLLEEEIKSLKKKQKVLL